MRRFFSALVLAAAVLSLCSMAFAVDDREIDGDVEDGVYSNDSYGFSVRVPQGWQVAPEETRQAVEKTYPAAGETRLFLLLVRAGTKPGEIPDAITILGAKFGSPVGVSFNTAMVYLKAAGKTRNTKILRPADAYSLGGTQVARQDVVTTSESGEQYTAQMLLAVRDRLISFQVHSYTRERMEEDLNALADNVEFQPDWQARRSSQTASDGCVAGTAPSTSTGAAPDGGCATRGGGTSAVLSQRMKLSEAALKGLLVSKVAPELPSGVEPEMIKAPVQMRVLVGVDGTVEKIWVFEGAAELAWNAVTAVRQWKFKPYAFEGRPAQVEGTVVVDFK